ncbi:MAG: hypothetical protein V1777_04325 [Candidatus Micrarchaeota archaeon]
MGLWEIMGNLPQAISGALFESLKQSFFGFSQPMLDVAKTLITSNIEPMHFESLWLVFIAIINAFYLLLFMGIGLKFIVGSIDAVEREQSKQWLKKAVFMLVVVNASLLIYSLILQASSGMTTYLWDTQFETLFSPGFAGLDFIWTGILSLFIALTTITLILRQIILIIGIMLFPVGLFLYFIPPLESYGKIILNILGITIFMQVLDVIILIAVQAFEGEFAGMVLMSTLAPATAFLLIFIANVLCLKIAIEKAMHSVGLKIDLATVAKSAMALAA